MKNIKHILIPSISILLITITAIYIVIYSPKNNIDNELPNNQNSECGHRVNHSDIKYGYNLVEDSQGNTIEPQGKPFQEDYILTKVDTFIEDYNTREYAQIFAYMADIRDALICDIDSLSSEEWEEITLILKLNNIKVEQDLTGTPKENNYSSTGIFEYIKNNGDDYNAKMKYLEEAELELKCYTFKDFDFTNPEGENHCQKNNIIEGSGLILP